MVAKSGSRRTLSSLCKARRQTKSSHPAQFMRFIKLGIRLGQFAPVGPRFCRRKSVLEKRLRLRLVQAVAVAKELVRRPHRTARFLKDLQKFRHAGGVVAGYWPILRDFYDQAGNARGHYFHQDLLVAKYVHDMKPRRHLDVGSRIDGFVAHVASFRRIEVIDIRPLVSSAHHQITFVQQDIMSSEAQGPPIADSISCLHAIEHFGLGRYGDPIDPEGHLRGFKRLIKILEPGGRLYISVPISTKNGVIFNAHRVFHPTDILSWPGCEDSLSLANFDYVDDDGNLHREVDLFSSCPVVNYGCGIYTFERLS